MKLLFSERRIVLMLEALAIIAEICVAQFCKNNNIEQWSYHGSINGVRNWSRLFPSCRGRQQSPIRMEEDKIFPDRGLRKLPFIQYGAKIGRAVILNNGHTVLVTPQDKIRRGVSIGGSVYTLQQMHFHWGSIDRPGAEHTINHIRYPMEVHFVHKNSKNVTAVVALLVKVDGGSNDAFAPIIEALPKVLYKNQSTRLKSLLNLKRLLPESPASFYRYIGSLTTPPCDEGVVWSILRKTTYIGRRQLDNFLKLYSVEKEESSPECLLRENYRSGFDSREVSASS